ncbi:hypothetical protein OHC33_003445 [Knufia fluminis]|uniref:Protein kinase domain-containing protein n=1 Tax=Knufia fluminis TaxID=191047 RepID=A0AAN8I7F1_9EURO|nr:hypothetical protein OHC33_003445 [Knufia fluminis]
MAQEDIYTRTRGLKLDTYADEQHQLYDNTNDHHKRPLRPAYHGSAPSQDTILACPTPPIEIPGQQDDSVAVDGASHSTSDAFATRYLKEREMSLKFSDEARPSSGHRHSIPLEPANTSVQRRPRGRSLAQALAEPRSARAHSESDRSHYDPNTGRHLPQYSESPPNDEPHIGEARFPLLQRTVDALASRPVDMHPMSMTSASTMSPVEEVVVTPVDTEHHQVTSPININSPFVRPFSSSYESPRPRSQRKASERWREGEAAPDFFSRAGSLKKSADPTRRASRRDTQSSTKSPRSAASSFLRGFSMSTGGDDSAPPPVDAEGATVGEDYVLGKQIGYGGFSIIREVKQMSAQTGTQRTLAVKIVKKQIEGKAKAENDNAQAEFEHEVDLWRLLNHKHILSLEAVYELKEATFCFIPLNVGGTLFDLVNHNRQGIAPHLAVNYCYQLASALRYLHLDARVVHRDIKLENCLIDTTRGEPGLLRLCDFGLAEWISNDGDSAPGSSSSDISEKERTINKYFGPAESSTSAFAGGSLEYAAPEILRIASSSSGHVASGDVPPLQSIVSPAVDIWATGVCIYAMLVGRRPFQDSFQPRVVMAILAGDWNKALLKEKAGEQAYKVVKNCLNMNSLRRPHIGEIIENPWFDDVRSSGEGSDADSESARASGWRL